MFAFNDKIRLSRQERIPMTEAIEVTQVPADPITAIEVAITLGAEIAAPVNSFLYTFHVDIVDEDDQRNNYGYLVGVYQSQESAEAGVRNWILERWASTERAPWIEDFEGIDDDYEEKEKEFLQGKTDIEVIKAYFDDALDSYGIMKVRVLPLAVRGEYAR